MCRVQLLKLLYKKEYIFAEIYQAEYFYDSAYYRILLFVDKFGMSIR